MSYQTRNEAIGYCLWAMIENGEAMGRTRRLLTILEEMATEKDYTNHDNLNLFESALEGFNLTEEELKELKSELYWTFDMKTVGEAGEFYEAFNEFVKRFRIKTEGL